MNYVKLKNFCILIVSFKSEKKIRRLLKIINKDIKFYVVEKIDVTHKFFKDFGEPTTDFTEYHFDNKTKFVRKV